MLSRTNTLAVGGSAGERHVPIAQHEDQRIQTTPTTSRRIDSDGHVLVHAPHHRGANAHGHVRAEVLVVEETLRRFLRREELVQHVDGVKSNNSPYNLRLTSSNPAPLTAREMSSADVAGSPKTCDEMLAALRLLAASLDRPVRRRDLRAPQPSAAALARVFGSWREALALALADPFPGVEVTVPNIPLGTQR